MAKLTVLSPRPVVAALEENPGPDVPGLRGLKVGLRRDEIWAPWDIISAAWAQMFEERGAEVRMWRAGGRTGGDGERTAVGLAEFLDGIDLAVVGLGN
jgi:hypothetical protein